MPTSETGEGYSVAEVRVRGKIQKNFSASKKKASFPGESVRGLFLPKFFQCLAWVPAIFLLKIFLSFKVSGGGYLSDNMLSGRGVIFAANHASELDPIVVRAALPMFSEQAPLFFVARHPEYYRGIRSLRKHLYGGSFFRAWGAYPARAGFRDYGKSLKNHIELLERGKSVLIFPEGTRTQTGELGEARGGVAFLVHHLKLPVVPVSIDGTYRLGVLDFLFRRRKLRVVLGKPVYPEDLFTEEQFSRTLSREEYREAAWFVLSLTRENLERADPEK